MAVKWGNLLEYEAIAQNLLAQQEAEENDDYLLFDPEKGFKPTGKGQQQFFSWFPITEDPISLEQIIARWLGILGGIGSGKSASGAVKVILTSIWFPHLRGLIVANTFSQLYSSTLVALVEACFKYNVPIDPCRSSVEETAIAIANARRVYVGKERMFWRVLSIGAFIGKLQTGRGAEYQRIWIDEGAYTQEQAFQVIDGRLRSSHGDKCYGWITTSTNGFNWLYYRFGDPARSNNFKELYWMVIFLTRENTNLDKDYIASLEANYTDEMAQQELEAAFIEASSGKIYKYFSRQKHTLFGVDAEALAYDRNLPIHIAFDFNAAPCVAVLAQKRANELHVFKEFFMLDADLWELIVDIRDFIKKGNPNNQDIHLYGDASGRAKSAVSKMSAWQIIFEELKPLGMQIHKHIPDANPPVRHRTHAVNLIFKNNRCFLAIDTVPELVKDLEQLNWDKDQGIDKTDSLRSHLSDALGYMVYQMFVPKQIAHHSQRALPSII